LVCKTDSLKGTAYTKIYCHTRRGMYQCPQASSSAPPADWTKTTLEMDVPTDTYAILGVVRVGRAGAGLVYCDDCSLEVVGASGRADGPPKPKRR
jgi:hypothetical protein